MIDIYCHIHTPINIEEEINFFIPPIPLGNNLYIIKEKKLQDTLLLIGYFQEYLKFTRENGYENISKWFNKKRLLNEGFLEAVSQYWIEDISLKQLCDYKYFQKNDTNSPVISEKYLKNIFQKVLLYNYIKDSKNKFNEQVEKELNIIENELAFIKDEKSLSARQFYYQNKIFDLFLDNFFTAIDPDIQEKSQEINNINFCCETLLSQYDLFVYKTGSISEYKDFDFKLTKTAHSECLRENTFIKLYSSLGTGYYSENYLKNILEELKIYSNIFTGDTVDFGVAHLKKVISCETLNYKKKQEIIKAQKDESSNVVMFQKTQTIISETEDHIISRYNSLKNYTNIYFAPNNEMTKLLAVLNMDQENLKKLNSLLWEQPNKIESELIKFTFKKGNLPYSAYGFASLNF